MTKEEFLASVAEALEVEVGEVSMASKMHDVENWDSLGQLSILEKLDQITDGKASSISELGSMTVLSDMFNEVKGL